MKLRFAFLICLVVALALVFGCASEQQRDEASSSEAPTASSSDTAEDAQEELTVSLAASASVQGALEEMAAAYCLDREWLHFQVAPHSDSLAVADELIEREAAAAASAAASSSSVSASSSSAAGFADSQDGASASASSSKTTPKHPAIDVLELPFDAFIADSSKALVALEEQEALDPTTQIDLFEDELVLVASAKASFESVTPAEVQAGNYPLALLSKTELLGKRQREVLEAWELYDDGAFTGVFAGSTSESSESSSSMASAALGANLVEVKGMERMFDLLASDPARVGIVRTSDLYRYGGVKVVGRIPVGDYSAIRYSLALAPAFDVEGELAADAASAEQEAGGQSLSEEQMQERQRQIDEHERARAAAQEFFLWASSDPEARSIAEKWGLSSCS